MRWCAVMCEQEVSVPKLFPQSREDEIVWIVFVCWSMKASFDWNSGAEPPPSRLTLHLAHCSQKSCCPGNGQTPTERRDMSPRSVSTALKSSGGVLYINKRGALHCTCWCKARRELVAMETHSIKRCPCANLKPTQSPSHGTTPSSLSSWERLVLSSRFAGFDLLHLWSWKWLGHLDSVIWMAEWIPVATYTWFKVQEHLKCCSFTGLQHPSVSAATATK